MACLDDLAVFRFVAGRLDEATRREAEAEIGRCPRCAALIAEVLRGVSTFRGGGGADGLSGGPDDAFAATPDGGSEGRYDIGDEIARGGMGVILRAVDRRLGRPIAIKCLAASSASLAARFAREIRVTASLQHPGVVPIYDAGVLPDGRSFYAMRHVPGTSFDRAIAGCEGAVERLGLLAPVLAVAEAVAYAHGRGIVHRDLKPSNVLVGPFGETVVIDWGLARVGDRLAPGGSPSGGDDVLATRDGAVLGTPLYMAPEQARGEPATCRSDVYALGAILYHALSGRPPVDGSRVGSVLDRVARADVPALAPLAPGLPSDLVAIVGRAMAAEPAARYADAGELAADLRRFQTGQLVAAHAYSRGDLLRRFARRHRTTLALLALFVFVLGAGGALGVRRVVGERARAERERERADLERAGAEDLVQFLLRDLRDKLTTVGRLDVLSGVADRVESYYLTTAAGRAERPGAVRDRAALYRLRAAVAQDAGDGDAADRYIGQGLALIGRVPADGRADEIRASLLGSEASRAGKTGRHERALALNLEAAAIYRRLSLDEGARRGHELSFAQLLSNAAIAAERLGRPAEAESWWREASSLLEARCERDPDDLAAAERLANVRMAVGQSLYRRGRLDEARQALDAASSLGARLVDREPRNAQHQHVKTWSLVSLADVFAAKGEPAEAERLRERAREAAGLMAAIEPASAVWQVALARAEEGLGSAAAARLDWANAAAHLAAARAAYEKVAARDPGNLENPRWAAIAAAKLAEAEVALGRTEAARGAFGDALGGFAALAESGSHVARLEWAAGLKEYAAFERGAGRIDDAAGAIGRALALVDDAPAPSERPVFLYYRAEVFAEAGAVWARQRRGRDARDALRRAAELLREAAGRAPLEAAAAALLRDVEARLSGGAPRDRGARRP